jgi:hypothetical protein
MPQPPRPFYSPTDLGRGVLYIALACAAIAALLVGIALSH